MVKRSRADRLPKAIIGWREWCALPELDLPGVLAKIDTGAKTSSLHAFDIRDSERGDGWLDFSIHPVQRRKNPTVSCSARCVDYRAVTSSNSPFSATSSGPVDWSTAWRC